MIRCSPLVAVVLLAALLCAACSDADERDAGSVQSSAGSAGTQMHPPLLADAAVAVDAGEPARAPELDASVPKANADSGLSDARVPDAARPDDAGSRDAGLADAMIGDDAGADDASELCDGSEALRLVAVRTAGGMPDPGSGVLYENGSAFLLVRGDCRYWVYAGRYSQTRTGQLTLAQRQRLARALRLDRFADYAGDYARGAAFDVPEQYVAFGAGAVDAPCNASRTCIRLGSGPVDTSQKVDWLESSVQQEIVNLEREGTAVQGAIRYVLAEQTWNGAEIWAKAATWPLGDPAMFAMSEADARAYVPGQSRLATGADAEALRALWVRFLAGDVGDRALSEIIPIASGSTRYHLFVRDSLSLEDAGGLLPLFARR